MHVKTEKQMFIKSKTMGIYSIYQNKTAAGEPVKSYNGDQKVLNMLYTHILKCSSPPQIWGINPSVQKVGQLCKKAASECRV